MDIESKEEKESIFLKNKNVISIADLFKLKLDLDMLNLETNSLELDQAIEYLCNKKKLDKPSIQNVLGKAFKLEGFLDKTTGRIASYYILVTNVIRYDNISGFVLVISSDRSSTVRLIVDTIGLYNFNSFKVNEYASNKFTLFRKGDRFTEMDLSLFYKLYNSSKFICQIQESL